MSVPILDVSHRERGSKGRAQLSACEQTHVCGCVWAHLLGMHVTCECICILDLLLWYSTRAADSGYSPYQGTVEEDGESAGEENTPFFIIDPELWEPEATPSRLRSLGVWKCSCLALLFCLSCCQVSDVAFWQ